MRALDDLVAAGKVRYIGFSDTPAWKVAQAQTIGALPRLGAARRAADRVLAARAHGRRRAHPDGAGAGPRRHAVVAAARRRALAASTRARTRQRMKAGRGARVTHARSTRGPTPSSTSSSRSRRSSTRRRRASRSRGCRRGPGVASTIIGARTMEQLDDNLGALDVKLTAEQIAALDKLSTPTLGFPMRVPECARRCSRTGGTTVNGEKSTAWPLAPKSDAKRY